MWQALKAAMSSDTIHVAVAVIINEQRQVLISYRDQYRHQGNKWEFPGGKMEAGETVEQALQREIEEELGLVIGTSIALLNIEHQYPEYKVHLHIHKVSEYHGQATGREGQTVQWCCIDQLYQYEFPQANQVIIDYLNEHQQAL